MFRLLLLTGQRRDEVSGMMRRELDLEGAERPGRFQRAEQRMVYTVPLSPLAVELIQSVKQIGRKGLVFTTTGVGPVSGYSRAKDRLDATMLTVAKKEAEERGENPAQVEPVPHFTLHDLRRSMASGMAALDINLPVIQKVLNHVSGSFGGIVGVYQRYEFRNEKRRALDAWSEHLLSIEVDDGLKNVPRLRIV